MTRKIVIAAGGTGGHMFPAQALAEACLADGWDVTLSTDPRGARYAGGFPAAVTRRVSRSATFARGGLLAKVAVPFLIASGVIGAVFRMAVNRPDVVIGFGGYPAIPAMAAAWVLRIPRLIHEQNGVLGRVNQLFARRVNRVACAVWPTELPAGVEAVHTGNPVRAAIAARAAAAYPDPREGQLNILVFGGSQGASILSRVVPAALAALPADMRARLTVAHQAREADESETRQTYQSAQISADIRPFFDDMPARLTDAALVIARSGASSVADITVVGRPSILVPLAIAIRDEQSANARALVENGAALLMQEKDFTAETLRATLEKLLSDPARLAEMAQSARDLGRPDAVSRLKAVVDQVAGQ